MTRHNAPKLLGDYETPQGRGGCDVRKRDRNAAVSKAAGAHRERPDACAAVATAGINGLA
jgi:hypothetical protein